MLPKIAGDAPTGQPWCNGSRSPGELARWARALLEIKFVDRPARSGVLAA